MAYFVDLWSYNFVAMWTQFVRDGVSPLMMSYLWYAHAQTETLVLTDVPLYANCNRLIAQVNDFFTKRTDF